MIVLSDVFEGRCNYAVELDSAARMIDLSILKPDSYVCIEVQKHCLVAINEDTYLVRRDGIDAIVPHGAKEVVVKKHVTFIQKAWKTLCVSAVGIINIMIEAPWKRESVGNWNKIPRNRIIQRSVSNVEGCKNRQPLRIEWKDPPSVKGIPSSIIESAESVSKLPLKYFPKYTELVFLLTKGTGELKCKHQTIRSNSIICMHPSDYKKEEFKSVGDIRTCVIHSLLQK